MLFPEVDAAQELSPSIQAGYKGHSYRPAALSGCRRSQPSCRSLRRWMGSKADRRIIGPARRSGRYTLCGSGWGLGEEILESHLDYFKNAAPDRFQIFGGVEWFRWQKLGDAFPEWAAKRLHVQKERGAQGLKIWKPLGLHVEDHNDKLVDVDDERLSPIWKTAGSWVCRC